MNLTELENTLSVSFPKLFQDIYNSGMLDYLTCPAGENPFDYKDICGNDREYFFTIVHMTVNGCLLLNLPTRVLSYTNGLTS